MVRSHIGLAIVVAMVLGFAGSARAADGDATGTWKWQMERRGGEKVDVTLKLKQDGEKLTGTISGREGQQTEIADGKAKDGTVSFKVTRKFNDREVTTTYTGKVEGDTLKGKAEFATPNGETRSRDFEAKRAKE